MAPKVDPSQLVEINLRVIGGEPAAASSLAPKIGPLGLSPKKEKGAAGRKHNGNISFDDVIVVTRAMRAKSLAATPKGTAKEVLGTCVSLGCTVEKKSPKDIQKEIDEGKWDEKFPKDLK